MKRRKSYFDDRILFDPKKNEIWVGGPDVKYGKEPWTWFLYNGTKVKRPKGIPKNLIEIDRVPEKTII